MALQDTMTKYGVKFDVLSPPYKKECFQYFMQNALWVDAHPAQLLGRPAEMLSFDLLTVTLKYLQEVKQGSATLSVTKISKETPVFNSVLSWFTTDFKGSPSAPLDTNVTLTTAPSIDGATHWGQQEFHVVPRIEARNGDIYTADWTIRRQKQNGRLLEVDFDLQKVAAPSHGGAAAAAGADESASRKLRYQIN
jgi:protein arginine N-methyltransferase 1